MRNLNLNSIKTCIKILLFRYNYYNRILFCNLLATFNLK